MQAIAHLEDFRQETRAWLEANCPASMRTPMVDAEVVWGGRNPTFVNPESKLWLERMAEKGWTTPTWPAEYGGGGLSKDESMVLAQEMSRMNARPPLNSFGISMLGPVLLESGTHEQKSEHIPKIVRGEIRWCQGYSEPGSGSDLASLNTKAVLDGDDYVINGSKVWTSYADKADWIFCLVRTDSDVPKHAGISFILFDMDTPGVTTKPIQLISGMSPFCETFFDNAIAQKTDLVGQLNRGWTVGKRLLQHERSGQGGLGQAGARRVVPEPKLAEVAKQYVGVDSTGKIADSQARREVTQFAMDRASFKLTQKRAREENESGQTMGEATSIFKLVGASWSRDTSDLLCKLRGSQGYGWEGEGFDKKEIESTRDFLSARAHTIYGGTNEVQLNIIAKRVLGLPE